MKERGKNVENSVYVNKSFEDDEGVVKENEETTEAPKPFQPPIVDFFSLFRYAEGYDYFLMALGIVGNLFSGLSAPANTFIFGNLTDAFVQYEIKQITREQFLESIDSFAINNSLIGLGLLIFTYLSIVLFTTSTRRQVYKIRLMYFRSALCQDVGWYDLNNTGDFASRMAEDLNKLEDGMSEKIPLVVHALSAFIGSIVLALTEGWELALISLSALPVISISIKVVSFLSSKLSKNELEAYAKGASIAEEVLSSIRTVVAFNGQNKEIERYGVHLLDAKKNNVRRSIFNGITFGLLWFLIYGTYGLAFWYGVQFVFDKKYTAGQMTTVFFSVMVGSMNFLIIAPYIEVFALAKAAAGKVFWVIERKSPIDPTSEEGEKPENIEGNIEFKNVHFKYPSRPDMAILKGISLKINKGQTVALVGSSGCGKSTCVQLIQRFYDVTEGQVLIDGEDIKNINVKHLRKHIGVVGQEPVLFSATIGENIRYSREDATKEEIVAAATMANAHSFVVKLPKEYDTLVGERGAQMSGGQKQRIAIARALVRNPSILLLDEATSALDNESEAIVQAALDKASKGRTTIIVAHRLSTIRQADKIIVLSKGEIVEEGTHDELFDKGGHYYDLVMAQTNLLDDDEEDNVNAEKTKATSRQISIDYERKASLEQYKGEESKDKSTKENERVPFLEILKMSAPEWKIITVGTIASMFMGFCSPFFAIVFGDIMGVFASSKEEALEETKGYCILFVLIGILMGVSTFIQIWMYGLAGEILTMRLRSQSFSAMLKQEMAWFDDRTNSVGALCARLSGDTSNVQGATGQPIGSVVQGISTISLAIGFAMFFQWKLGLTTLALTPLLFAGSYFMAKNLKGDAKKTQKILEKSSKIAVEAVGNIRTVAGLGREISLYNEYEKELKPTNQILIRGIHIKAGTMGVSRSLMFFAYAICMFYGGRLIADENEDYKNIFKVTQTLIMASFSLANAFAFAPNFQKGLASATNIYLFLRRVPEIRDSDKALDDPKWGAEGNVLYNKINFRYPSRPKEQILKNFSLEVLKGKKIALVGHSGCGKSTLIQLLERFYDAESGDLKLDCHDTKKLKLNVLRKQLGIVSQEPILFDKTIAENIAYGDNDRVVPMNEIIDTAEQANIHNFISSLPLGYDTPLGEKGTQLSGGQKQRVAIARALIRKPKVLLLDEATSALDTQSEKVVQEALDKAGFGRTCITIAHRLSTIVDADLIVVIKHGRVAEIGTHAELIAKKGLYRQLYTLQGK